MVWDSRRDAVTAALGTLPCVEEPTCPACAEKTHLSAYKFLRGFRRRSSAAGRARARSRSPPAPRAVQSPHRGKSRRSNRCRARSGERVTPRRASRWGAGSGRGRAPGPLAASARWFRRARRCRSGGYRWRRPGTRDPSTCVARPPRAAAGRVRRDRGACGLRRRRARGRPPSKSSRLPMRGRSIRGTRARCRTGVGSSARPRARPSDLGAPWRPRSRSSCPMRRSRRAGLRRRRLQRAGTAPPGAVLRPAP